MSNGNKRLRVYWSRPTARASTPPTPPAPRTIKQSDGFALADLKASSSRVEFSEVKDGNRVIDHRDVRIAGYLSTFKSTTPADRDGDYVEKGAFRETIPQFMKNPVLLANHQNSVGTLCGKFVVMREDQKGLYIEAELSNSPAELLRHVRALVAEGTLRTLSMGGRFHYADDGRGIVKVELFEGSLTPIPANPDAIFKPR